MPTQLEESPEYPQKVQEYLDKVGISRLPWGCLVSGGHITYTKSTAERAQRAALGEACIELLEKLKIPLPTLFAIVHLCPSRMPDTSGPLPGQETPCSEP